MTKDNKDGVNSNTSTVSSGLALVGVRDLDPVSSEALRVRTLPAILSLLMAEPTAQIRFDYESDEEGLVSIKMISTAQEPALAHELRAALARLIAPVGETAPAETDHHTGPLIPIWSLAHTAKSVSPGFSPSAHSSPMNVIADGFPYASITDLLEGLIHSPGYRFSITFSPRRKDPREPLPDFEITISVTGVSPQERSQQPPLALAAAINRLVPGSRLEKGVYSLLMSFADAGAFPLIPASSNPLPGLDTAPAAPVPIRHHPGLGQPDPGVAIGQAYSYAGKQLHAALNEEEQVRHIHVTGRTGTGKSTFLATMAHSIATLGQGLLVVDPHGTLVDRIAAELPEQVLQRTLLIRVGNLDHPAPLNPLATEDPVKRHLAIADILAGFYAMFDPGNTGIVGPRFEQTVGMCLRTLAAHKGMRASILDVPQLLTDTGFQRMARRSVTDAAVRGFWSNYDLSAKSNEHGELIAWITSKWERFTTTAALRAILGTGEDALNFEAAMEHNHIVLLDLSKGAIGEAATSLLGFLYTSRIWTAALNRKEHRPFTVMVDEAHSLMAGALPAMLSEGRKYGLSVVVAHQYLEQLPAGLSQALAGNTATQVAFRAGRADAEALHQRMGRLLPPEIYTNLPDLSAIVQRTAGPTTAHPHTITVSHHQGTPVDVNTRLSDLEETTIGILTTLQVPQKEARGTTDVEEFHLEDPELQQQTRTMPSFLDRWLEKQGEEVSKARTVNGHSGDKSEVAQDKE